MPGVHKEREEAFALQVLAPNILHLISRTYLPPHGLPFLPVLFVQVPWGEEMGLATRVNLPSLSMNIWTDGETWTKAQRSGNSPSELSPEVK